MHAEVPAWPGDVLGAQPRARVPGPPVLSTEVSCACPASTGMGGSHGTWLGKKGRVCRGERAELIFLSLTFQTCAGGSVSESPRAAESLVFPSYSIQRRWHNCALII